MPLDQHFLRTGEVVEKLVEAGRVCPEDVVVDIGAGEGVITAALALRAGAVYAAESDPRLIPCLRKIADEHPNVKIFCGNFLKLRLPPYTKVVANPPFSILEPLVMKHVHHPVPMSLLAPKRFSERMAAPKSSTLLSYMARIAYIVEVTDTFPGEVLTPPYPGKLSILKLHVRKKSWDEQLFLEVFRRKGSKVRNALRNLLWRYLPKRQATRLVELSDIPDHLLGKRVSRMSLDDAVAVHKFIREVVKQLPERYIYQNSGMG